ncbi:SH3 domain-containing protein [Streptomyces pinistramenti]|uniref:SH3 domain-containing protein n=1 Tax=Streptomyces pinistramenti TaxID=2884812 RepID=UPI001D05F392|nr:SH3 domain-containing protein [Streptomyces pinistramenti]MCB5912098.1 SH3 domain-containing protein [Streptomyces pinistramenti]
MSMTGTPTARGTKILTGAGALTAAVVLGTTLLGAAPAQATPSLPYGTVIARTGLNQRQYPSVDSSNRGFLAHNAQVGLRCKVRAQNIGGNEVWYLLRDRAAWVSAKYVANTGVVAYCKDVLRGRTSADSSHPDAQG